MLQRNKIYCPDTGEWGIFFCQPKSNSAGSLTCLQGTYLSKIKKNIYIFGGIFQAETLFQKLWPLLNERAELDLRLTIYFSQNQAKHKKLGKKNMSLKIYTVKFEPQK